MIIGNRSLSKKAQELLSQLGKPWTKKVIDLELCVYRDLGEYEIEVSCYGSPTFDLYVWQKSPGLHIVEKRFGLERGSAVYNACRELEAKYSDPGAAGGGVST